MTSRADTRGMRMLLAVCPAVLVLHAMYYYPFFSDDGFISLRYAQRLMDGKGLTWNDGLRVEGYSNLLWVLLTAFMGWLGFSLEGAARGLGLLSALLTLPALSFYARRAGLAFWPLAAGFAVFVLTPPVAIWAMGGLESCLVMLLFAWALVLLMAHRRSGEQSMLWLSGLALALICPLRPEGPVYTLGIAAALLADRGPYLPARLRLILCLGLFPLLFFLVQLAFRLSVYGQYVPNTVLVKVAFTPERMVYGFVYVAKAMFAFLPLLLYAFLNGWGARRRAGDGHLLRDLRLLALTLVVLSAAIALEGGDIFAGFRAFVPLAPVIALMVMLAMAIGLRHTPGHKEAIFFLYIFAGNLWIQFTIDVNVRPHASLWEQDAKQIGLLLKERYGDAQPLLATHAAGAVPFFSQLPTLDVFGLNDSDLAGRKARARLGKQLSGHELFDGEYVESRKPDLLLFDLPGLPPLCTEDFEKECAILLPHYHEETLHIPGHDVTLWVRGKAPR